ncbi:phosphotransferase [Streptomyces pseudovenezuelae]|uniref:phosphotransferase n=1 Tax=Streptomyces pseudovenezuelae TaxID=67350 RepID=UPI002E803FC0|nr:phosphotransferase [Streptomyces pseudovenezuelae]
MRSGPPHCHDRPNDQHPQTPHPRRPRPPRPRSDRPRPQRRHPSPRRDQEGRLPAAPRRRHDRRRLRLVTGRGLLGRRTLRPPRPLLRRHQPRCVHRGPRPARGRRGPDPAPAARRCRKGRRGRRGPAGRQPGGRPGAGPGGRARRAGAARRRTDDPARAAGTRLRQGRARRQRGTSYGSSAARRVTEGALRDIGEAALRDERIAEVREDLEESLRRLDAAVRPRDRHSLIHGELGPDHVLLDDRGRPALIDVEGLMYFDVEWEHVFLRIRFQERYDVLRAPARELDEDRLRLYRLAMHLSLVAGPLRLVEGDFPHPEGMREIAEHNLGEVLTLLRSAS